MFTYVRLPFQRVSHPGPEGTQATPWPDDQPALCRHQMAQQQADAYASLPQKGVQEVSAVAVLRSIAHRHTGSGRGSGLNHPPPKEEENEKCVVTSYCIMQQPPPRESSQVFYQKPGRTCCAARVTSTSPRRRGRTRPQCPGPAGPRPRPCKL